MDINMDYITISGQRLRYLVDFLFSISDRVELVSINVDDMTKKEYETVSEAALLKYEQVEERLCEKYQLDKPIQEHGYELMKVNTLNDIQQYEDRFIKKDEDIDSYVHKKFNGLKCIDRVVTFTTHCTESSNPMVVYSFLPCEDLKKRFLNLKVLTDCFTDEKGEYLADDPAFYYKNKLICSVCSHESYIHLHLDKEQFESFLRLNIPYRYSKWEDTPDFPHKDETILIFFPHPFITTLLGNDLFDMDSKNWETYSDFYTCFMEQKDRLRNQVAPNKRSVKEIIEYMKENYTLIPYQSKSLELQILRNGMEKHNRLPLIGTATKKPLDPNIFLYRIHYRGEDFLIGGEYNSNYLFVDSIEAEKDLKEVIVKQDKDAYGFMRRSDIPAKLFDLIRELNLLRGMDEYDLYDDNYLRGYLYLLNYPDIMIGRFEI